MVTFFRGYGGMNHGNHGDTTDFLESGPVTWAKSGGVPFSITFWAQKMFQHVSSIVFIYIYIYIYIYICVRNELRTVFLRRFMAYILVGIFRINCSYVWMGWNHFEPTNVHGGRWGKQFSYRHQQQLPVAPQAGTRNTVTAWTNMWRVGQTTRPRR